MDTRISKNNVQKIKNNQQFMIGFMGSDQYKQLIPVFEEYGYKTVDLQAIYNDEKLDYELKERRFQDELEKCDLLYNLYSGNFFWAKASYAKKIRKIVFTHWIGTDALDAVEGRVGYLGSFYIDHNFSCYEGIKNELQQIGIHTTVLPIVPFDMNLKLAKMPKRHSVLIYLPEDRLDYYGFKESCVLFEKFSDIKFHIVGNKSEAFFEKYKNVVVHGVLTHKQMDDLYNEISILVRWVRHDGLSMSVIEALAKGKEVIWNFPYDGVHYVKSVNEMCEEMKKIVSVPPILNMDASEEICSTLTSENFIREFESVLMDLL